MTSRKPDDIKVAMKSIALTNVVKKGTNAADKGRNSLGLIAYFTWKHLLCVLKKSQIGSSFSLIDVLQQLL